MDFIKIAARIAELDNKKTCVYVDLDETLIHTVVLSNKASVEIFKAYPGEKFQMETFGTMLRPGAIELLESLHAFDIGPVYLLTHSVFSYANAIVQAFKLDVDLIFSRENLMGNVGKGEKKFVIIDDIDPLHLVFQMKAQSMGIPLLSGNEFTDDVKREYFSRWQIRPSEFLGDPSDRGLHGIAEIVAIALCI